MKDAKGDPIVLRTQNVKSNFILPAKKIQVIYRSDSSGVSAFLASASQDANGWLTYDYATKEKGAYPLGIVSYLLADTKSGDKATAAAVSEFAKFILSPACSQKVGEDLGFSVIDSDLLKKSLSKVAKIG